MSSNPSWLIAIAALAGAVVGASDAQNVEYTIQAHCRAEWPSDFVMREYCIKEQRAAAIRLGAITPPQSAPDRPGDQWLAHVMEWRSTHRNPEDDARYAACEAKIEAGVLAGGSRAGLMKECLGL